MWAEKLDLKLIVLTARLSPPHNTICSSTSNKHGRQLTCIRNFKDIVIWWDNTTHTHHAKVNESVPFGNLVRLLRLHAALKFHQEGAGEHMASSSGGQFAATGRRYYQTVAAQKNYYSRTTRDHHDTVLVQIISLNPIFMGCFMLYICVMLLLLLLLEIGNATNTKLFWRKSTQYTCVCVANSGSKINKICLAIFQHGTKTPKFTLSLAFERFFGTDINPCGIWVHRFLKLALSLKPYCTEGSIHFSPRSLANQIFLAVSLQNRTSLSRL